MNGPSGGEPTPRSFVSQSLRLNYVDWGNPGAPTLILLHGGRDHCRSWDWVAHDLCADFHVIAPDLRGHGDSQWSPDGSYAMATMVLDLAELVRRLETTLVSIVGHSLGGNVALRYAGTYPENVAGLVAIEGLGPPAALAARRAAMTVDRRMRDWIERQHRLGERPPRRYASLEDAQARMQDGNRRLSPEQARHLTLHAVTRNEDGSYSWKFDNYVRAIFPVDITADERRYLWGRISCPTLLVHGRDSPAPNPVENGDLACFSDARVAAFDDAGHWVHHDRLDAFVAEVRRFLLP